MNKFYTRLAVTLLSGTLALGLAACKEDSPAEEAGEAIDDAAREVERGAEDLGRDIERGVEDLGD
jgi:hypothetical protein